MVHRIAILFLVATIVEPSTSILFNQFYPGDCPALRLMKNFQMEKFLGEWLVLENSNDNRDRCLREYFDSSDDLETKSPIDETNNDRDPKADNEHNATAKKKKFSLNSINMARYNELETLINANESIKQEQHRTDYGNDNIMDQDHDESTNFDGLVLLDEDGYPIHDDKLDQSDSFSTSPSRDQKKIYNFRRKYLPFGERQSLQEKGRIRFLSDDLDQRSEWEIDLPFSETGMLNMKHYQVIATDYQKYAIVWRCQSTIFGHRRSAQLMGRSLTSIDPKTMLELRTILRNIEKEYQLRFYKVRQNDCDRKLSVPSMTSSPSLAMGPTTTTTEPNRGDGVELFDVVIPERKKSNKKEKKKLINIDVGGFHLSISFPFW
ncbi:nucleolar protein 10 [Sarcoptes scabiei]|nr:nucleolar protein 10 [Sarcoptes scabiei]